MGMSKETFKRKIYIILLNMYMYIGYTHSVLGPVRHTRLTNADTVLNSRILGIIWNILQIFLSGSFLNHNISIKK